MTLGFVFLVATGAVALLAGALVIALSPGRTASLLSGAGLLLVGLLELGWARATDAISWGERNYWLDLSFVCALPVALAWLLVSITLGRGHGEERFHGWRIYIPIQALLSLGAVAGLHWFSPVGRSLMSGSDWAVPLTPYGGLLLGNLLLNLILVLANFEATYLAFSARWRRAFRPALLCIIVAAGSYGAVIATSVLFGRFSLWEISLASIPTGVAALLLPHVLLRRRVVEATITGHPRPLYETVTFVLGILLAGFLVGLGQVMRWTGWTLPRASWVFLVCAVLVGLTAIAVSSRLQRLFQRLLEPYVYESRLDREAIWTRLSHELDGARTREELFRLITAKTAEIGGVSPVTLFIRGGEAEEFSVVGSTIEPWPSERVAHDEPLARELRASRHPIHFRGRADDLAYIPIYVENAKQFAACEAVCAVPLTQRGHLAGFLLCGNPEEGGERLPSRLPLLEVVAQMVTSRLTSLERGE